MQVGSLGGEDPLEEGMCSCLENPMDRGAWGATVYRVSKSWMWLSTHTCCKNFIQNSLLSEKNHFELGNFCMSVQHLYYIKEISFKCSCLYLSSLDS